MSGEPIGLVDLRAALRAIDPAYLDAADRPPHETRVHALAYCASDARLYVVVADAFVFWSADGGQRWHEVREVNRGPDGVLHPHGRQSVDMIADTMAGTVLLVGRDRQDGDERAIVWRKPSGGAAFARHVVPHARWGTSKGGNITAGFMGTPPRPMVAFTVYASPAHLWYSLDDGVHWARHDLAETFALHTHEVYLPRSATMQRAARLWVTGGDDPSGARSGVVTFERVAPDGTLDGVRHALRERPGYRLVGLAGDGKHVYIGNESLAGGMLRILDNAESIERGDFEYVLGKHRHDYHQFRSMVATPDGVLAAATDSYAFVGDTVRADSGGYLYLSADGGASFREISLGMKWITGVAHDGRAFWVAGGVNREHGPDPSELALTLLRVPKPAVGQAPGGPYAVKLLVADSSAFYRAAASADAPAPKLDPGERTFRADLSPYASAALDVETLGPATLVVEALPFQTWHLDEDAWREVLTVTLEQAGTATALLPAAAMHNRWFRVRNGGTSPAVLRRVALIGRR